MNKSRLLIAVAVLIGLSVAVVMTRRSHQAESTLEKPTASVPKLKKEELTAIEITRPGQPPIVLQKQSDKWRMSAPVAADTAEAAVESVVDKLADLDVTSVAATRKENHQRLEVDPSHAIHVVAKGGEKVLADLHIGASKSGGTMVRVEGSDDVLALRGSIRHLFDREVKDFRDRDVTDIDNKELSAIAISSAKGNFKFVRDGEKWAQAPGEKPLANFDPEKVPSFLNTAAHLYATDFADAKDDDSVTGLSTPASRVTLTKQDGTVVELLVGKQHVGAQDYYLRSSAKPDVIYRVSNFNAERLIADAKLFEKDPKAPEQAANPAPSGMPMAGGGELPPEIMKQLQQQMQMQGQAGHGPGGSPH